MLCCLLGHITSHLDGFYVEDVITDGRPPFDLPIPEGTKADILSYRKHVYSEIPSISDNGTNQFEEQVTSLKSSRMILQLLLREERRHVLVVNDVCDSSSIHRSRYHMSDVQCIKMAKEDAETCMDMLDLAWASSISPP